MNWKHSIYQLYATTLGQAFTIDEAYRLLRQHEEDRQFAIASAFAETERSHAKVIDAKRMVREYENTNNLKAEKHRCQAAILETKARYIIAQPCLDMARLELHAIQHLIELIDARGSRMYENFAVGNQMVQPMEYAFDYLWTILFDGANGDLMRNIWANPYAQEIIDIAHDFRQPDELSNPKRLTRVTVSLALAKALDISPNSLAITVNMKEAFSSIESMSATYSVSHQKAVTSLQENVNEQLSRDSENSIGLESPS